MKYVKKLPGIDHELSDKLCNDGWKKLKEPGSSISAVLLSVPFMFLLDGVTMWISYLLKPELFNFLQSDGLSLTINLNQGNAGAVQQLRRAPEGHCLREDPPGEARQPRAAAP